MTTLSILAAGQSWYAELPVQVTAGVALLTAVGAAVTGFATRSKLRAESGKTDADAAKVFADTALELLEPYRKQVADLRAEQEAEAQRVHRRMLAMQADLAAANDEISSLRRQLSAAHRELSELRMQVRGDLP